MSSSILTNMSAMTAVQNLAATQKSLATVQNEISTGLAVSSAKDNAAYYSIAQTMRTNVSNLSAVSSSLNLGSSVVSTASSATGQITSILQSISSDLTTAKGNIGNSSTMSYLNTAISALNQQLATIVSAASFNGTNLLDGSTGSAGVSFVSGITGTGSNTAVTSLTVNTTQTNLSGATYNGSNTLVTAYVNATNTQASDQSTYNTDQAAFINAVKALTLADYTTPSTAFHNVFGASATYASGKVTLVSGDTSVANTLIGTAGTYTQATGAYVAGTDGDLFAVGGTGATGSNANQTVTSTSTTNGDMHATATALSNVNSDTTASKIVAGKLFTVGQITLSSSTTSAQIDNYIKQVGQAVTDVNTASEVLGAVGSQIDLQSTYTSSLSDSLTSGVGSLVDADMNEASTRLSALQTQQQLGVQALSVANQNSQLILKLFQG